MKKVSILIIALIVSLCFAACADNGKKADVLSDVSSKEPAAANLPTEREITVSREGNEEVLVGTVAVSDSLGYAIYLLPEYELRKSGETDSIAPKSGTEISSEINMQIYEVASDKPIPKNGDEAGAAMSTDYRRFNTEDKILEIKLSYPSEAAEGGAVLLKAMADTICKAK